MRIARCFIILLLLAAVPFCLAEEKDPVVEQALGCLVDTWNEIAADEAYPIEAPYLQVIYTRAFDIDAGTETGAAFAELYPDVVTVIHFDVIANYFNNAPVYTSGIYCDVLVKADGSMEVSSRSPFDIFRAKTYIAACADWVTLRDYGNLCNGIYIGE